MIWGRFTCTSQSILIETIIKVRIVITSKLDQMRQEIVPIKVVLIKRKIVDFILPATLKTKGKKYSLETDWENTKRILGRE